jgi:hypothetical protein
MKFFWPITMSSFKRRRDSAFNVCETSKSIAVHAEAHTFQNHHLATVKTIAESPLMNNARETNAHFLERKGRNSHG